MNHKQRLTPVAGKALSFPSVLPTLTTLRGPAALTVFCFHIAHNTNWFPGIPFAMNGYLGVSLFFVLSGFVLTWSFREQTTPRGFYLRRFARVYPLHAFFWCIALIVPVTAYEKEFLPSVANLALLQAWIPSWEYIFSMNGVSWSLSCEMFFYFLAPFIIQRVLQPGHKVVTLLLVWWAAALAVATWVSTASNFIDVVAYSNPLLRSGEFVLGIVCATVLRKQWKFISRIDYRLPLAGIIISSVLVALMLKVVGSAYGQTLSSLLISPMFALLIVSSASWDIARAAQISSSSKLVGKLLVYLGEVSFAFYLAHELVIKNIASLDFFSSQHSQLQGLVWTALCFILALGVASVAHHFIEKPAQRTLTSAGKVR